jgi:hypothetical protein
MERFRCCLENRYLIFAVALLRPCEPFSGPKDSRKARWFSFLFKMGEWSVAFQGSPSYLVARQPTSLSDSLSSSLRIDVIVGTPSDVLVGCVRPAPQQC